MIVKCPACAARFRLDRKKLAGKRVTLRCARCRNPFKVELPHSSPAQAEKKVRVMIAHSDLELCSTIRDIVENAGFEGILGHDGREVLAAMDAVRPQIAVVDVALQAGRVALQGSPVDGRSATVGVRAGYDKSPGVLLG